MRLTRALIDDMARLRQGLRRAYDEELCLAIDPVVRRGLLQEMRVLNDELARAGRRLGATVTADPF